jgi:Xaa-Pro aminopeptidase
MSIPLVQSHLKQNGLDGWLLYDFRRSNRVALDFLKIPKDAHLTRRLFYWIPPEGEPVCIVHAVETHLASHLHGEKRSYASYDQLNHELKKILNGAKKVAMEYSPRCDIPTVSKVDAGMVELIRSIGPQVVSSAFFLQYLMCQWSDQQLQLHREAGHVLDRTAQKCWAFIADKLKKNHPLTEYEVQQFILKEIHTCGCIMDGEPICAVNANSAIPHYAPSAQKSSPIKKGDWILIDLWCKKNLPGAVYADITRVAVAAPAATPRQEEIFQIVRKAQLQATELVKTHIKKVHGYEVDAAARKVITDAGYGDYFTHRTGHNIHEEAHGPGANIDGFETHDDRLLIPRTCFSIEPGIYLPEEFGVRLEYDVYLHPDKLEINGGIQDSILKLQ